MYKHNPAMAFGLMQQDKNKYMLIKSIIQSSILVNKEKSYIFKQLFY